jgi:hypothetical protein
MSDFTALELAALHSIFAETPEWEDGLLRQLEGATVVERDNSGGGFFTTIGVAEDMAPVDTPRVLGNETYAKVEGMEYGLGFILFMKDGRFDFLEGYSYAGDGTSSLDLENLNFEIFKQPWTSEEAASED